MCRTIAAVAILLLGIGASPARAFDSIGAGFIDAGISGAVMQGIINQTEERGDQSAPPGVDPGQRAALTFTPSAAQRQQNYATFVARTRTQDPAAAAQLEQDLSRNDVIAVAEQPLRDLGFDTNDVADSYAFWLLTAWLASQGRDDVPPAAMMDAVRDQAATFLAAQPVVVSASDAAKQELAEAYLLQGIMISVMVDAAQSDPARLSDIGTAVRQGASAAMVDLDALDLTAQGFVPR